MKSILDFQNLFIHRGPVDMRKNINGLSAIVEAEMKLDLRASSLFIFCNQRRTHMKMLYFDKSGFALWMKRLEESRFPWPTYADKASDLMLLLEGVNVWTRFEEVHFERVV